MPPFLPPIADGEDKRSILGNRIRKNYRHLRKWAKKNFTDCFRIYGRDIKEYPIAIDFYAGRFCVHYFSSTGEEPSIELKQETRSALATVFGAASEQIFWRTRSKESGQYEKRGEGGKFFTVYEFGLQFRINLTDYLDTGLFLDHRETRRVIAAYCPGKSLLNLFAYTCSFSLHASCAGAIFTKSVDLSNTYGEWGRENFLLNHQPLCRNEIVRADCLTFLQNELSSSQRYDVIVIDPPTISRSKKMNYFFDVNVDYVPLITQALSLLNPEGVLFFSTNSRRFCLDTSLFKEVEIVDISHQTIPLDFRDKKIHFCWKITTKAGKP